MNLSKWSLKKIEFLLSHIEEFIEDDNSPIREAVSRFEVQTGLEKVSALHALDPSDPDLSFKVFEKIAPFYEAGLLFQFKSDWRVTDFFWRGQVFGLEPEDQIPAGNVMREISPLQVNSARARALLGQLGCDFIRVPDESRSFLFRPAESIAYVLISNLPDIWSADHVEATHTLLNRSFSI